MQSKVTSRSSLSDCWPVNLWTVALRCGIQMEVRADGPTPTAQVIVVGSAPEPRHVASEPHRLGACAALQQPCFQRGDHPEHLDVGSLLDRSAAVQLRSDRGAGLSLRRLVLGDGVAEEPKASEAFHASRSS